MGGRAGPKKGTGHVNPITFAADFLSESAATETRRDVMTFELEQIFAQPLTTTVFLYASTAMLVACAFVALWLQAVKRPGLAGSVANARW